MERIRFSFARKMPLAYISHLDTMRLFLRALRRSGLPLAYSQGYNPHPRLTLALPLPLGVTASGELGEIIFAETVGPGKFIKSLSPQLPESLELTGASVVSYELPSLAAKVCAARYRIFAINGFDRESRQALLQQALDSLMAKEEIILERINKKKKRTCINIRPFIYEAAFLSEENKPLELNMLLKAGSSGGVSPFLVVEQLGTDTGSDLFKVENWHFHREKLYGEKKGKLQALSEGM